MENNQEPSPDMFGDATSSKKERQQRALAIARLRAEAALRSRDVRSSRDQDKPDWRTAQQAEQNPAKRAKVSKKLATCPGITSTSLSGKIMRPLPSIWGPKKEPAGYDKEPVGYDKEPVDYDTKASVKYDKKPVAQYDKKPDVFDKDAGEVSEEETAIKTEMKTERPQFKSEVEAMARQGGTIQEGAAAGLLGPDSTFSYSPVGSKGGVCRVQAVSRAFDNIGNQVSFRAGTRRRLPSTPPPRPKRPTPIFSNEAELDTTAGTIPWLDTSSADGGEKEKTSVHHHHHLHLPPAPTAHIHVPAPCLATSATEPTYVDDCVMVSFSDESLGLRPPPTASYRTATCHEGQVAASPTSCNQRPAGPRELCVEDGYSAEDVAFNMGLRRLITQAALEEDRKRARKHHHHQHHHSH